MREAAQLLLGEDEVVSHGDLEDPAAATDELGLDAELLLDLGRQTGGTGIIVSARAVFDGDMGRHGSLLSASHYRGASGAATGGGGRLLNWRRAPSGH